MARAMATPWRSPPESWPTIESGVKTFEVKPISRIRRSASACSLRDAQEAEAAGDLAAHEDVADDGLLDRERAILEHGLDAGVARARAVPVVHLLAADEDVAAGRLDHAGEDLDQRRLAGAVVADQADHLAAVDMQVDAAEREDAPVGLGHFAEFDQSVGHGPSSRIPGGARPPEEVRSVRCA